MIWKESGETENRLIRKNYKRIQNENVLRHILFLNVKSRACAQYYLDMLLQYDSAFKPENKIVSEMQVRQDYVDYIYSDQFKNDFERAYNDILEKRNGLVDILIQLQEAMNQEKKTISWTEESRFTIQMKYSVDALNDLLRKKEQDFASAQDKITKAEERRAFLEDRIPASEQFAKSIVQESLPRVNTKIGEYVLEKQQEIEALNKKIQELQEEYARIQGALIIFGKRAKLEKLDADIEEVKAKVIPLQTQLDEQKKILSMRQDGKEDDEILAWMKQVSVYIKKVQDEVRLCSNAKEEYSRFFNELSESDDNIKAAYEGYHRVEAEQYSEEIKKTIQYLYEQLEKYSLVNIYQQIYDESVQVFKEKNGVKSITGKCHRYDLYVQLMFAMKYFNKKIGNMQFICVDEGQDLAVNEYRLLSELNQNHVVFNIFGDTNQLMKSGRGISDWNLLLSELQAEQYVLNENYRNTNQITRFCNDNFGLKTLQTGVDGPKVREISRRDLEKELAGLMITTERIAILLPRTVQKMKYLDMDILPENIRNMIGETMDNGFISVMYVDEVKGIEFDKVFVVSAAMHRNEKYIAYTRALSELIVVVDEKLMNNNSAKKVKENIEHNKKAGIHSAKMPGTLKWEKTKQPKAYTLEKTIDNDVITYHFTENTKSIIKNEFANTDSILPSSIASSPLTNIKKNIYAHCVYIENSICYNINCKENMGKKCNKEGNCDYYISLPVPPDEEELIAEDIDNAKKYLAKYS
ncbi:AAA family ATPase [Coprococcus comes]|uniref:AAA family ATPase n=1 Tax=Coprococcus comes TaxID=410072 RepID=UPI001D06B73E|nr:AAA family ATPase [Coprococcus comes]MCB6469210.1 AAA family ATPase [Coprococcus comes]